MSQEDRTWIDCDGVRRFFLFDHFHRDPHVILNVSGFLATIASPFYSGCSFGLLPSRLASKWYLLGHPQGHKTSLKHANCEDAFVLLRSLYIFWNVFIQVILILTSPAKHRISTCGGVCPIVPWSTIFSLLTVDISVVVSASTNFTQMCFILNSCGVRLRIHTGICSIFKSNIFSIQLVHLTTRNCSNLLGGENPLTIGTCISIDEVKFPSTSSFFTNTSPCLNTKVSRAINRSIPIKS